VVLSAAVAAGLAVVSSWGTGSWGTGPWGTARTVPGADAPPTSQNPARNK